MRDFFTSRVAVMTASVASLASWTVESTWAMARCSGSGGYPARYPRSHSSSSCCSSARCKRSMRGASDGRSWWIVSHATFRSTFSY